MPGRELVLGLGNDLLGDDGAGLRAAREVAALGLDGLDVIESGEAGLALLELLAGYESAVIVDSIQTGAPPGTIHVLGRSDFARVIAPSAHYAGLPEVFDLGEKLGIDLPAKIAVVAVEVEDPFSFSECLTPAVSQAMARVVDSILEALGRASPAVLA